MSSKDLLFLSPQNTQLGGFKRFVPRSVPLGTGILAAFLEEHGVATEILDDEVHDLTPERLRPWLERCAAPRLVGIGAMTANAARAYQLAGMVKTVDPEARVVMGGIHATVLPDEVLSQPSVDFIVKGEAEHSLLELVRQLKSGSHDLHRLEGVGLKLDGQLRYTRGSDRMVDVNEVPGFPYEKFDRAHYDLGFILTSRGCPFDCIFCSQRVITKRKYRYRASDKVIEELDYLVNRLGQPNITFFDDFFTGHKERVLELCGLIRERGLHRKAAFGVQTRGDSVNREILEAMRAANFNSLMFGVETASERVMKLINKGETVQENVEAIRLAREMGFTVEATFIFGFPTETFEERSAALSLAVAEVDRARFNNVTPYPGTALFEMVRDEVKILPGWVNFSSAGAVTKKLWSRLPLPYAPAGSTRRELEGSVLLANLLFYLNFTNLKRLFNTRQQGSGKWFELTPQQARSPAAWLALSRLGLTVAFRILYYLVSSRNCRRLFFRNIRR